VDAVQETKLAFDSTWHDASFADRVKNELPTMSRNKNLVFLAVAALFIGLATSQSLFLPALKLLFADWFKKLTDISDAEKAVAAWNFCLGFTLLAVMVPLSALVTERFAARAGYGHALMKSLLIGALALGASLFYQLEHLASLERLAAKLGQPIGALSARLAENPLAKIVWFTAVCLVIFGPLDLWIAHLQKQSRPVAAGIPSQQEGD
jgi:MFS family permease